MDPSPTIDRTTHELQATIEVDDSGWHVVWHDLTTDEVCRWYAGAHRSNPEARCVERAIHGPPRSGWVAASPRSSETRACASCGGKGHRPGMGRCGVCHGAGELGLELEVA